MSYNLIIITLSAVVLLSACSNERQAEKLEYVSFTGTGVGAKLQPEYVLVMNYIGEDDDELVFIELTEGQNVPLAIYAFVGLKTIESDAYNKCKDEFRKKHKYDWEIKYSTGGCLRPQITSIDEIFEIIETEKFGKYGIISKDSGGFEE
jgi:hypothetical protein